MCPESPSAAPGALSEEQPGVALELPDAELDDQDEFDAGLETDEEDDEATLEEEEVRNWLQLL